MLTIWLGVVALLGLVCLLVSLVRRSTTYWKSRGVAQIDPLPLLGNYLPVLTLKKNAFDMYDQLYRQFPSERMVGLYEFTNPTLVLRDPELIEQVLVREFSFYPDHGPFLFEKASGLHTGLFNLYGERWRALRNQLLYTFTTGRLRTMFDGITACCEELLARSPDRLDRDSVSQFASESFLRSLFGCQLPRGSEANFHKNVVDIFHVNFFRYIQQQFLIFFPRTAEFVNCKFTTSSLDGYFRSLVSSILSGREGEGRARKDFTEVLLQLKNRRTMQVYSRESNCSIGKSFDVTEDLVVCQGLMFFFAGMDTTSLAMLYTAFELATNPGPQGKARAEVRRLAEKHGGLTFDAIREMKYLERCIQEALRLHPSLAFIMRITEKPTELGGVQLEKGTRLIIPNFSLQMDPKHFPEPEAYDPDRFDDDRPRNKFAHLPFSEGPRVCLGKKFSLIEIATLFAHLLQNYQLTLDPETKVPITYQQKAVFVTPQNPVVIKLTKIQP